MEMGNVIAMPRSIPASISGLIMEKKKKEKNIGSQMGQTDKKPLNKSFKSLLTTKSEKTKPKKCRLTLGIAFVLMRGGKSKCHLI
jgi:hypothetical protein